ncbi:MAG: peptidylprolyl isomerase [Methanosarcinaceae archaeon]|nr:peptidylprolyl isomerase [Methanosarcinaceae archaeon]
MRQARSLAGNFFLCLGCIFLLGFVLLGSGCTDTGKDKNSSEATVKLGDSVSVDYIGKLADGTVFDTSIKETAIEAGIYNERRGQEGGYKPLNFTLGTGQVIKGFDEGVIGMKVGDEKTLTIPPEKAYGEYSEELVQKVPLDQLNLETPPVAGQKLRSMYGQVSVLDVNETHVTLDFNHELAGETLTFEIKLVSLK